MRNIFNQFKHPENCLTHAFACCLHHDRNLLKSFLTDLLGLSPPEIGKLKIIEQALPNKFESDLSNSPEVETSSSLPDMIIFDEEGWCVIIESKVTARICKKQIKQHFITLKRRGYSNPECIVIAIEKMNECVPGCKMLTWNSIYLWINKFNKESFWANELKHYFEVLEKNMTDKEYLTTGTITDFIGIPFDDHTPFSYLEGKRVLKLMLERLKERKQFDSALDIDYNSSRGAIKNHSTIWDVIPLKNVDKIKKFTDAPHFTFGLTEKNMQIMLTLPDNAIKKTFGSFKSIESSLVKFAIELDHFNVDKKFYSPRMKLNQRHYPHRCSDPIDDGILEFDLRTMVLSPHTTDEKVKKQKGWLDSLFNLCQSKSSNMQLQIGVFWSYKCLSKISPEQTLELVERSCNAMAELVSLIKK